MTRHDLSHSLRIPLLVGVLALAALLGAPGADAAALAGRVAPELSGRSILVLKGAGKQVRSESGALRVGEAVVVVSDLRPADWLMSYTGDDVAKKGGEATVSGELDTATRSHVYAEIQPNAADLLAASEGRAVAFTLVPGREKARVAIDGTHVQVMIAVKFVAEETGGEGRWQGRFKVVLAGELPKAPKARDDVFEGIAPGAANVLLPVLSNDDAGLDVDCFGRPDRGGEVAIVPGQGVRYTPADGFSGTETFSYTARSAAGASSDAFVVVRVETPGASAAASSFSLATASLDASAAAPAPLATTAAATSSGPTRSDQIPANESTTSMIEAPGSKTVELIHFDDENWHAVRLEHKVLYHIEVELQGESISFFPRLLIFDSYGVGGSYELLDPNWDGDLFASLDYSPPRTEYHYIGVEMDTISDVTSCFHCRYVVRVQILDDFTGTLDTNGRTGGTYPIPGAIERGGDADWFAIDMTAGERYEFRAKGEARDRGALAKPYLRVRNAAGSTITSQSAAGEAVVVYTPPSSGRYYVSVESGISGATGDYTLRSLGGNIPSDPSTWAVLPVGGSQNGLRVNNRDSDWYRVQLEAGAIYRLRLEGSGTGAGTLAQPYLGLADDDAEFLMFDDQTAPGGTAQLVFAAPETRTYYAVATGPRTNGDGTYRISLDRQGDAKVRKIDVPGDDTTPGMAVSPRGLLGVIDGERDEDWYSVYVRAGEPVTFTVEKNGQLEGGLGEASLRLVDTSGNEVATGKRISKRRSRLTYAPDVSEDLFLVVAGADGATGGYLLRSEGGDVPQGRFTWARLDVGTQLSSTIWYSRDADTWRVRLDAGQRVRIEAKGADSGSGTLLDPAVELTTDDGETVVASDGDGGTGRDALLEATAPATGEYLVTVYNQGGFAGSYTLGVRDLSTPGLCGGAAE